MAKSDLQKSAPLHMVEPLRHRVPTHDTDGRALADFMVLIPGLREQSREVIEQTVAKLHAVCAAFQEVVFVELNLQLNLLWVSHRYRPGICPEIVNAMQARVPRAVLVGWAPG